MFYFCGNEWIRKKSFTVKMIMWYRSIARNFSRGGKNSLFEKNLGQKTFF